MIRREFLIVSSMTALATALPAVAGTEALAGVGAGGGRSAPAAEQWQKEQERVRAAAGMPSRQERYRWQL